MPNPRLASRYAKSVVDLALEKDQLDSVFQDMVLIDQACQGSRELVTFFRSPVIHADKKEKIFKATFKDNLSVITSKFVTLLFRKSREEHLPEIAKAVIRRYKEIKNIREVKLTTAHPLSEFLVEEIKKKVHEEIPHEEIELKTVTDKELIGGFILESNNNVFDASIARKLRETKKQFIENKYISKI